MRAKSLVLLLVSSTLFCEVAYAGPPGSGICNLRARRAVRRDVLGFRPYEQPPAMVREARTICQESRVSADSNKSRQATSFTSDRPKLELVAGTKTEYLYFDLTNETYWLAGERFMKSLTPEQAKEYINRNPVSLTDSENLPDDDSPSAKSASDKLLKHILETVPLMVTTADSSKEAGWADYDQDGSVDEYFPPEKQKINPEIIKALKELKEVESTE